MIGGGALVVVFVSHQLSFFISLLHYYPTAPTPTTAYSLQWRDQNRKRISSHLSKEMSLLLWFGMVNFLSPNERLPETVAIFEGITKVI